MKKFIPIAIISSPFLIGILGYLYMTIDISKYSKYFLSLENENTNTVIEENNLKKEEFSEIKSIEEGSTANKNIDSQELNNLKEENEVLKSSPESEKIKEFEGLPIFDVVQIAPNGQLVIAGRAKPGDIVELIVDSDKSIDSAVADSRGEFVFVPDELLSAGGYELSLKAQSNSEVVFSEETVLAKVPESEETYSTSSSGSVESGSESQDPINNNLDTIDQEASALLLDESGMATAVLQESVKETPEAVALSLDTLTFSEDESLGLSGRGTVGFKVYVYLDNNILGSVEIQNNGRWLLISDMYLAPGKHLLRLDQHGKDNKVISRVEIPFIKPEKMPDMDDKNTIVIKPGDTLWAIAKKRYGFGIRYTMIFTSNRDQIKNPDLIYPGQIFIIPLGDEQER